MMKTDDIAQHIKISQNDIIQSLKQEYIDVYLFLKSELEKETTITNNYLFQFVFRSFYGMNRAGLTSKFYEEYFETLEKYKRKPESFNLKKVALEFLDFKSIKKKNEEKKSLQFSFLTKLYHSINMDMPIYDKYVCKTCGLSQNYILDESRRLESLLNAYGKIEEVYSTITKENLLSETVKEFDEKFKNPKMNVTMKYDFIFWQAGKLLEERKKKGG